MIRSILGCLFISFSTYAIERDCYIFFARLQDSNPSVCRHQTRESCLCVTPACRSHVISRSATHRSAVGVSHNALGFPSLPRQQTNEAKANMADQSGSSRPVPHIRNTLSAALGRIRLHAFTSREKRARVQQLQEWTELINGNLRPPVTCTGEPYPAPTTQTLTCTHIFDSWFSQPAGPEDRPDGSRDAESARATLRELLAESVIFGRISVFYPPHPAPSMDKQSAIRSQLLAAFESLAGIKGDSSETRFTRFADLPAEIRHQIWLAALPCPGYRTLHIGQKVGEPYSWTARLPLPTLSSVCRESREVVLKTIFPIYGHAPYRSGPGSSQEVTRRFLNSWASSNDCLDFGATSLPAALRCGDYLERVPDFHATAQSLSSILLLPVLDDESRGSEQASCILKGAKQLMVVIQVVYITLPTPSSPELTDPSIHSHYHVSPPLAPGAIQVRSVDSLADTMPFDADLYQSSVLRRPKEHHVNTVASLRDRTRIKELLALGEVTGYWAERKSRLWALHYHSNAFCMDCLLGWWEKHAHGAAREALLRANSMIQADNVPHHGSSTVMLPELIPAVRFKIQWPGLDDHSQAFGGH